MKKSWITGKEFGENLVEYERKSERSYPVKPIWLGSQKTNLIGQIYFQDLDGRLRIYGFDENKMN